MLPRLTVPTLTELRASLAFSLFNLKNRRTFLPWRLATGGRQLPGSFF